MLKSRILIKCLISKIFIIIGVFYYNSFIWGQLIDVGSDITVCSGPVTLNATIDSSYLGGGSPPTQLFLTDDEFSGVINLGFSFTFYGNTYTQCVISSNNFITFDLLAANQFSAWTIVNACPDPNPSGGFPACPLNAIMGPWQDILPPSGGTVSYQTVGTAPNRLFVVEYCNVPMFSCTGLLFSSQIVLKEGSNDIETHIINKPLCTGWNAGQAIHGLQNFDGSIAHIVPGRNAPTQWIAANEGYRFVATSPSNYNMSSIPFQPVLLGSLTPPIVEWFIAGNSVAIDTGLSTIVNPSITTTYVATVSGTACSGLSASDTVIVNIGNPIPIIAGDTTYCAGDSVLLNTTQPFLTYLWSTGDTTSSIYVTQGSYNVYVTANGGCDSTSAFFNVNIGLPPTPTITGNLQYCQGANTTLNAGVGYTSYLWSNGGNSQTTSAATPGIWSVTVMVGSCSGSDSVSVIENPNPAPLLAGDTIVCGGDSSLLSLTNGPFNQYSWSTGDTTSTSYVSVAGTYTVTVTDGNSCSATTTIDIIMANPVINITAPPLSICNGDSLLMTASPVVSFSTVIWSDGNLGGTNYATSPGLYFVTGTEPGGCEAVDTVIIGLFPDPTGNIIASAVCSNTAASFSFNNTGLPITTYYWDFGNGAATNDTSVLAGPNYQYPGPGIYPVVVIVGTADGCIATMNTSINIDPLPSGTITNVEVCEDHDETFNFSQTSTDSIVSYSWVFPGGLPGTATGPNPIVNFGTSGTTNTYVIITNQYGCIDTIAQPFIVRAQPTAGFETYPICISRFTFDPTVFPNDNTVIIDWNLGDGTVLNNTDTSVFNHIYMGPGDYNASLVITDEYGCEDSITKLVHVDDSLFIEMPNVLVQTSTIDNDKIDMEVLLPGFNLCINWTYTVFDRWGVQVFETKNDPYNPDLDCDQCFRGKDQGGEVLIPGVYYYIMKGNFSILKSGFITIFE